MFREIFFPFPFSFSSDLTKKARRTRIIAFPPNRSHPPAWQKNTMRPAARAPASLRGLRRSIWRAPARAPGPARHLISSSPATDGPIERTYVNRHKDFPAKPHVPTLESIGQPIFETHPHLVGEGEGNFFQF